MKKNLRLIVALLTLTLLLFGISALATDASAAEVTASGSCGTNVTWAITDDFTLIISGTGAMNNYVASGSTPWSSWRNAITAVIIEEGVIAIGEYAFSECGSLTSVTIGKSVTSVGESAFYLCTNLTGVYISDIAAWCKIDFQYSGFANPLWYAHNLYLDGELVTDLVIPEGITVIKRYAFFDCDSLISVTLPKGCTAINASAFSKCNYLKSITIPAELTYISDSVFSDCGSLYHVAYAGTQQQWSNIAISIGNDALKYASCRHYEAADAVYHKEDCTGSGVYCDLCGKFIVQKGTVGSHTVAVDAAVTPTCTETGLTEGSHCGICNTVLVAQEEVPATGHNYVNYKCALCGHISEEVVASVGDVRYISFGEALVAAFLGETVQLYKDITEEVLVVRNGIALDLNGCQLQVTDYAVVFGQITDSAEGVGLLKVLPNAVLLQEENSQLPIYDTENCGYRFFSYSIITKDTRQNANGTVSFGFRFVFENDVAYNLLLSGENAGISMEIALAWDGGDMPQTYRLSDELIRQYARLSLEHGEMTSFILTVKGLEKLEAGMVVTATPAIASKLGIGKIGNAASYINL